ncbi:hypothetical protein QBC40DRAFT_298060 [Triangularia verruculosa]|uniref:HNH nuclease domain-containing protein n=1 Tax=Triangularia verruculosa TaxID=2587418 RepID=A0AAN6XG33_9PEZI|nr:hypothetical protein QBC40DRAFT_298060 [Triangularia verruculosa]
MDSPNMPPLLSLACQASALDRQCQRAIENYPPLTQYDDTKYFLQTLLHYLPLSGRINLMSEIAEHADDPPKLRQIRNFLVDTVLRPAVGFIPKDLRHAAPVAPEFQNDIASYLSTIDRPSSQHDHESLRQLCLERDQRKCLLTGLYDVTGSTSTDDPDLPNHNLRHLECAHILPFLSQEVDDNNPSQARVKAIIWWAYRRYFDMSDVHPSMFSGPENAIMVARGGSQMLSIYGVAFEQDVANRKGAHSYNCRVFPAAQRYSYLRPLAVSVVSGPGSERDLREYPGRAAMPKSSILRTHFILATIMNVRSFTTEYRPWNAC